MLYAALLAAAIYTTGCSKSDNNPDPGPGTNPPPSGETIEVSGTLTGNVKWTKNNTYLLRGYVYVENGATLDIEPGTKIVAKRDLLSVLVVYMGGKINAIGTPTEPIVFTSGESNPQPGDLGGLVLVGKATGNGNHAVMEGGIDKNGGKFGGDNDADNSGTLKYVRIEYAGKAVSPGNELNGLTLYTVGSGTTIDYVQVVRGVDDAFEFFGGAVNCKHLIAYNNGDDDFDLDDGYHGKIQFAVSIKDPQFTDQKPDSDLSNNFEVDNTNGKDAPPFMKQPNTRPVLSNFTAIGPNNATGTKDVYGYGMRWRRGSQFVLANSIVIGGQKGGLIIEDAPTATYYQDAAKSRFYNSLLHAVTNPFLVLNAPTFSNDALKTLTTGSYLSVSLDAAADAGLTDPFNNKTPNLQPKSGTKPLTMAAKFDMPDLNTFFEKVTYLGAFDGTNDWTKDWTVWNK